jgi:hypothetical protein
MMSRTVSGTRAQLTASAARKLRVR